MDLIYYYLPALETVRNFLELGGNVLLVIGVLTLFMWMLIIERLVYIRRGHRKMVNAAIGIWVADLVWTILGTNDLNNRQLSGTEKRISIGTTVEPVSNTPLISMRYRF